MSVDEASRKEDEVEHAFEKEEEKEFEFEKTEGTSTKSKTIDVEESLHNSIALQSNEEPLKQGGRPPRRKLVMGGGRPPRRTLVMSRVTIPASQRDTALCVDAALSHWNEKSLAKQGPEYELVEKLGCIKSRTPLIWPASFHCNFTARPKNASEAETKLFFADLMYKVPKGINHVVLTCLNCRIIGPVGTKTGLYRCRICRVPDIVQHPKGRFRAHDGYGRKRKR